MDPVAICRLALGFIGAKPIDSLVDESVEGVLCAAAYPIAVKAVLEARAWTFATTRLTLQPGAASGVEELPRKFALPSTVVRVLAVDDGSGRYRVGWAREGENVLTDDLDVAYVKAIDYVDDPKRWSGLFARAVAYRLAADLATPITQDKRLAAEMELRYQRELAAAGTLDGMQGSAVNHNRPGPAALARL